jgi:hypothetical protein
LIASAASQAELQVNWEQMKAGRPLNGIAPTLHEAVKLAGAAQPGAGADVAR